MPDRSFLAWPFLADAHRELAERAAAWAAEAAAAQPHPSGGGAAGADAVCREWVRRLGTEGWLRWCVPIETGGAPGALDVRALCLLRETLAYHDALADFAFALQGLGAAPITLFGTDAQRGRWLPPVAAGEKIGAFALSEAGAGSDVAAMTTTARRIDGGYRIDGAKTWISNGGIADHYVVFCRFPEGGERAFLALMVGAEAPGFHVAERLEILAPHPLATLVFEDCRVRADALIGKEGEGMRVALGTLDVFRPSVGAAALGMARRALDEALAWAKARPVAGGLLADQQITQARLAEMALAVDTSALLVYRAAWTRDSGAPRITREAAMAKLHATEVAQRVIDDAVQLLGARGLVAGCVTERLYREIRALRIYEGTTEIQKLVIAGQLMKGSA